MEKRQARLKELAQKYSAEQIDFEEEERKVKEEVSRQATE